MRDEISWFDDPEVLLVELKKTGRHWGEVPRISGYDRMVEISRGGQGVVYRARQRSTNRTVAVKVLLDGRFASEENRLRFQREVELISKLRHPAIVSIYDSGITPDGRLYYVMEYVDGQALDSDSEDVETTLGLFVKICDAVQHAHRHGIIHRDLKPGNILVDGKRDPHILDFGLAKIVEEEEESASVSRTGQFFGSLAWASPEQIERSSDKIDIRTDVYSLGVLLYQVLTSRLPHLPSKNLHETIQSIVSEAPERPRTLRPDLPGDVETMVLRCLAKEPERRYQSAGELLRDIRHFLDKEPIDAKRDHTWYVLRKTLGRHKAMTALLTLVLLLIVGFSAVMAILYPRALRAEKLAKDNMEEAVTQAARAEAVRDFLTSMIADSDPFVSGSHQLTVRQVLDAAALKMDGRFGDHPLVEAEIRTVMGDAYYHLGHLDEAEAQDREALALLDEILSKDHLMVAKVVGTLGLIKVDKRSFDEAEEYLNRTLEIVSTRLGKDHVKYADGLHGLAGLRQAQFRLEDANELYGRADAIYEQHADPGNRNALINKSQWAGLLISMRQLDAAIEKLQPTLAIINNDPKHAPLLSAVLFYLGLAEFNRGELTAAEDALEKALQSQVEIFGEKHPRAAEIHTQMGHVRRQQRRFPEAEERYRRALDLYARLSESESAEMASGLWNVAQALWYQNKFDDAEATFKQALSIRRKVYGPDHHYFIASLSRLGMIFSEVGQWEKALPYFEEAASIYETSMGKKHPLTARARALLGECLVRLQRYEAAEPVLRESLEILESAPSPNPTHVKHALDMLILLYTDSNQPEQVEEMKNRRK